MRIARSTLIGTAVAMALFGRHGAAQAQQTSGDQTASNKGELQEVVVTGIRASLEQSLELKREAITVVDVITAEDIGKMPDKNVADSLKRVPGVTISSAGANEGGFDENDRVSMRGTNPSLTQTLIDGHYVASGDWFVLNQTGTVGRSVSYTLLPSELVSKVVVQKSSEASLVEGGVAGSVNIVTRKPLDLKEPFTFQASAGAVYADLPSKTDPQFSALASFHDADSTFGVLAQGFYEKRHLRRDGVELLGYDTIKPGSAVALADPNLSGVQYPTDIGSAFFEQERKRAGGLLNVQFRPNDAVNLDLSGFYSKLDAPNFNRNYLLWDTHFINFGSGQAPDPGYVVNNNTLTNANFTGVHGTLYGIYDQISRPDESADSGFINLNGNFVLTQHFRLDGQVGWSQGHGKSPTQNVSETSPGPGAGAFWDLNGVSRPPDFNLIGVNNTVPFPPGNPGALPFGWIFGAQNVDTVDKETWAQLDATFDLSDSGAWKDLRFGARYDKHDRSSLNSIAQGPTFSCNPVTPTCPAGGGADPANYPTTYSNYPSDYTTFGSSIPTGVWYWTPSQLAAYNGPGLVQRDPVKRAYPPYWFQLSEPDTAAYLQADFKGSQWSANVGVRWVQTKEETTTYSPLNCFVTTPPSNPVCPAGTPNLVAEGSLFGAYQAVPVDKTYDDVLPSANFRYQFQPDLIGRLAAGETMTRPDYSALAGATNLTPPGNVYCPPPANNLCHGSGSASNQYLKPITSWNYDAGLEYYFAPRSLVSATLFYMDLKNYVGYGTTTQNYLNFGSGLPANGLEQPYDITIPTNVKGRVQGVEVAYQQAFGNFGIDANYTYADGKQTEGVPPSGDTRLVGTSKNTYNISGYYENAIFSARISYNYRSAFYSGLDRSTAFSQDSIGTLAASLAWYITNNWSLNFDGQNLNNPTLKYYALDTTQPRAFYRNGRQYYLTVRAKF